MQVISSMRVLMTEDSNNAVSNSFLLDDDSRSAVKILLIFSVFTEGLLFLSSHGHITFTLDRIINNAIR